MGVIFYQTLSSRERERPPQRPSADVTGVTEQHDSRQRGSPGARRDRIACVFCSNGYASALDVRGDAGVCLADDARYLTIQLLPALRKEVAADDAARHPQLALLVQGVVAQVDGLRLG
jgi:hypothetical protein